jgi:putative membrane protein
MNGIAAICASFFVFMTLASAPASAIDANDRDFARRAAIADMAEIELANLAKQKAKTDAVREYAEHLLTDHQQSSEKLKALAAQKNIALPKDLDSVHKAKRDKLAALDGPEFEKAYIDGMIKDHRRVLQEFQTEAKKTKDAEFKAFASEIEPKLRQHLDHAQKLQEKHSSSAKRS